MEEEKVPSSEELLERYAEVQGISKEEAVEQIGADTPEAILENIRERTLQKIREKQPVLNRAQRRALKKKVGAKKYAEMVANGDIAETISDTAKKLNYIHLIQKLRELNEKKAKEIEENGDATTEDN